MIYIREGNSSNGKILATLSKNCIIEGSNVSGQVMVNFEGKLIREGTGINGEILANLDGNFIREGKDNKGEILAIIMGQDIYQYCLEKKLLFNIEGFASIIEKAGLTVAALMLKGQL